MGIGRTIAAGGVAWGAVVAPAVGQFDDTVGEDHPAQATLVSELADLHPGETQLIGVRFDLQPKWHLYWDGQNDTGLPVTLDWELPGGFRAGEIRWPVPTRYTSPGDILDHVYEDRVTLLVPLSVPANAQPGSTVTLSVDADWLVCADVCIPGWDTLTLELPVASAGAEKAPGDGFRAIESSRASLPVPLPEKQRDVSVAWSGDELLITPRGAFTRVSFYPSPGSRPVSDLIKSGTTTPSESRSLRLTINADASPVGDVRTEEALVRGVIDLERGKDRPRVAYLIELNLAEPGASHGPPPPR